MNLPNLLLGVLIGALPAALLVWLFLSSRCRAEHRVLADRNARLETELAEAKKLAAQLQAQLTQLTANLATAQTELVHSEKRQAEFARELEQMQQRNQTAFENLANRLLDEKAARFTAQNQTNLDQLLSPLKQQLTDFKKKVEDVYTHETAERRALREQIESLRGLNLQVTEDARNLTLALKGDSKAQGTWGELILERVLERSGLTRDVEFTVQTNLKSDTGANLRPDVLIHLPQQKHFVIDSKVSLTAYERSCSAETPDGRAKALLLHAQSIRAHVQELAEKNYQDLYQITAPDFVFMFIPVEPALGAALQADAAIFNDAFDRKVILVTPSTLLVTLRTVAQIWKQEKQTRNALEIARKSGALYDKFEGLYQDLLAVGDKLRQATAAHQDALDKLKHGRGNLISRVEDLKKLGAKAQKALPGGLVEEASEADSSPARDDRE
jgi:DNA recombination protein RmuC